MKWLIAGLGMTWFPNILAQTTPTTDSPELTIAQLIVQVGLSGIFLFLFQQERKERRESDARWEVFAEKGLPVLDAASKTLERVHLGFTQTVDRAATVPSRNDIDVTVRRQELVTDELANLVQALRAAFAQEQQSRGGQSP